MPDAPAAGPSRAMAPPAPGDYTLPSTVADHLRRHFAGWAIPARVDYARSFWSFYDSSAVPFFTTVDLNDDRQADHGILLQRGDSLQGICLLAEGAGFTHRLLFKQFLPGTGPRLQYCLMPEAPGRIDVAYPTLQSLLLRTNGINLMELENRICLYYWDQEQVAVFRTQ